MDAAIKAQAKELFVEKGFSIETITTMLMGHVSRKTLYNWRDSGGWNEKRRAKIEKRANIRERLEALLEKAITEAENNLTAQNLFAVGKAAEALRKATFIDFSDEKKTEEADKTKDISNDTIKEVRKLLGLN